MTRKDTKTKLNQLLRKDGVEPTAGLLSALAKFVEDEKAAAVHEFSARVRDHFEKAWRDDK